MENSLARRGSRSTFSCSTSQVVGAPTPLVLAWCLFRSTRPHLRKQSLLRNRRVPVFPTSRSQPAHGKTQNHQSRSETPRQRPRISRISALQHLDVGSWHFASNEPCAQDVRNLGISGLSSDAANDLQTRRSAISPRAHREIGRASCRERGEHWRGA